MSGGKGSCVPEGSASRQTVRGVVGMSGGRGSMVVVSAPHGLAHTENCRESIRPK